MYFSRRVSANVARFALSGAVLLGWHASAQEAPRDSPNQGRLAELSALSPRPRVGAPPQKGDASARASEWQEEKKIFAETFEAARRSWDGKPITSSGELRARVREYEDLVQIVTASGGYGNMLLADSLRRLSLALLVEYALAYPREHAIIEQILAGDRLQLLESAGLRDMIAQEIGATPPQEQWHLWEKHEEWEILFRAAGSNFENQTGRMLLGVPSVSKLLQQRDVNGLLLRLMETECAERVNLAGFLEFLKRGGRFEDIRMDDVRPFLAVMEKERGRFQFPAIGIRMVGVEHLAALVRGFNAGGAPPSFTKIVVE